MANDRIKVTAYSISINPISGICKQPALWAVLTGEHCNASFPLIYFQKPKWLNESSFLKIVKSVRLDLPRGFEAEGESDGEQ